MEPGRRHDNLIRRILVHEWRQLDPKCVLPIANGAQFFGIHAVGPMAARDADPTSDQKLADARRTDVEANLFGQHHVWLPRAR